MNASNTDFEPASPLRVARSSLRNRCPERRRCAIPVEELLHAHATADEIWLDEPSPVGGCAERMMTVKWGDRRSRDGHQGEPSRQGVSGKKAIGSGSEW